MSPWRRFVRWLARHELAQAYEGGRLAFQIESTPGVQMLMHQAYARGEADGAEKAFKAVERHLAERMGGASDLISTEDLVRAKKGILH